MIPTILKMNHEKQEKRSYVRYAVLLCCLILAMAIGLTFKIYNAIVSSTSG